MLKKSGEVFIDLITNQLGQRIPEMSLILETMRRQVLLMKAFVEGLYM